MGLLDVDTLNKAKDELVKIEPNIMLYGALPSGDHRPEGVRRGYGAASAHKAACRRWRLGPYATWLTQPSS